MSDEEIFQNFTFFFFFLNNSAYAVVYFPLPEIKSH